MGNPAFRKPGSDLKVALCRNGCSAYTTLHTIGDKGLSSNERKSILVELNTELHSLQQYFADEVNRLRNKYFTDNVGLSVIPGNERFEVAFHVDIDRLKRN